MTDDSELIEATARAILRLMSFGARDEEESDREEAREYARAAIAVVRGAEGWPGPQIEALRTDDALARRVAVFLDHWGLDSYEPPEDVRTVARFCVTWFMAQARPAPPEDAGA